MRQGSNEAVTLRGVENVGSSVEEYDGDTFVGDGKAEDDRDKSLAPAPALRARKVHAIVGKSGRQRRDAAITIRLPGHDRKKPYSCFHRFEKVTLGSTWQFPAIRYRKTREMTPVGA